MDALPVAALDEKTTSATSRAADHPTGSVTVGPGILTGFASPSRAPCRTSSTEGNCECVTSATAPVGGDLTPTPTSGLDEGLLDVLTEGSGSRSARNGGLSSGGGGGSGAADATVGGGGGSAASTSTS